ncbi:MAG: amidohydrolase family protein [Pseudonocardiaceae bacterium]|nr:amidohydrolase family protein [Pseudonocardiaceae bacterium]
MSHPRHVGDVKADLVFYGGTVLTLDAADRRGSALAVRDGRVLAVGDDRDVLGLAAEHTRRYDLRGRTALPGFVETHTHPYFFGLTLDAEVDAGSPPNDGIEDIVERVAAATRRIPRGEWIVGYRYDDTLLRDGRHPTRHDLDAASSDHPVLLVHVSGHFVSGNSLALRHAGIGRASKDPPGGLIARDASGEPTGMLAETAAFPLYALLPKKSEHDMAEILGLAGDAYLAAGVTTVHDTGIGLTSGADELAAYRRAVESGRLRTRVRGYLLDDIVRELGPGVPGPAAAAALDDDRFRIGGVKIISDGSIQGLTGCLSEPYTCAPSERGMMLLSAAELTERIAALHDAGWQVAVHGNGDAAIQAILDAYRGLGTGRADGRRHRIEHCQTVREDQLDTMAEHGIAASFFVKHVYYWGDRHRDRFLGPERARRISPLVSAGGRGLRFGLHADTPVTPVAPLEGIWCAVHRRTRDGVELGPEQRVDVRTALRGYTSDAAYLGFDEEHAGTLEPGKRADVALLSGDPTATDPTATALAALTVDATVVAGDLAWVRDHGALPVEAFPGQAEPGKAFRDGSPP